MAGLQILLDGIEQPESVSLKWYRSVGGYQAAEKALKTLKPDQIIDEVKASGLAAGMRSSVPMASPSAPAFSAISARRKSASACAVAQLHGAEPAEYLDVLWPYGVIKTLRVGPGAAGPWEDSRLFLLGGGPGSAGRWRACGYPS